MRCVSVKSDRVHIDIHRINLDEGTSSPNLPTEDIEEEERKGSGLFSL